MSKPETLFLVPVKSFDAAKSRLKPILSARQRRDLARNLVLHTLKSLPGDTLALVNSPQLLKWINQTGYNAYLFESNSLNSTLQLAFEKFNNLHYSQFTVIPTDLFFPYKVSLIETLGTITIIPDHKLFGTNLLSIPKGISWRFQFGKHSFIKHLHQAQLTKYPVKTLYHKDLSHDIDEEQDLLLLPESLKATILGDLFE
jgi:2-phospho-L-lactate guanylyltransferase